MAGPRQLDTRIKLRASCIDRVPDIVSAIRNYLITKCAESLHPLMVIRPARSASALLAATSAGALALWERALHYCRH